MVEEYYLYLSEIDFDIRMKEIIFGQRQVGKGLSKRKIMAESKKEAVAKAKEIFFSETRKNSRYRFGRLLIPLSSQKFNPDNVSKNILAEFPDH